MLKLFKQWRSEPIYNSPAMFVISQRQLDAFSLSMRHQFETRMVDHLRSGFPDNTYQMDERTLSTLVVSGLVRAESYGIEFEWDLQRFLEYMMVLSFDFDTAPGTAWAGEILRRHELSGSEKITRIDTAYVFRHAKARDKVRQAARHR